MPEPYNPGPLFRDRDGSPEHPMDAVERFGRRLDPYGELYVADEPSGERIAAGLNELCHDFQLLRIAMRDWYDAHECGPKAEGGSDV